MVKAHHYCRCVIDNDADGVVERVICNVVVVVVVVVKSPAGCTRTKNPTGATVNPQWGEIVRVQKITMVPL